MNEVDPRIGIQAAARRAAEWISKRDTGIRVARERGYTLREIAEWSGLSKDTVATITRINPKETSDDR